jgi:hypothetical protein
LTTSGGHADPMSVSPIEVISQPATLKPPSDIKLPSLRVPLCVLIRSRAASVLIKGYPSRSLRFDRPPDRSMPE